MVLGKVRRAKAGNGMSGVADPRRKCFILQTTPCQCRIPVASPWPNIYEWLGHGFGFPGFSAGCNAAGSAHISVNSKISETRGLGWMSIF
jgi:hypothetical protein